MGPDRRTQARDAEQREGALDGAVYALLAGIDVYPPPVPRLAGCENDVQALATFLEGRLGDRLRLQTLVGRLATRAALIEAIRAHLSQARAGDVALFAWSGHGSEEPAPPALASLEPGGWIQSIVPVDVGRRDDRGVLVRPLADKELAVLFGEVTAGGPHVIVLLDCCHSGTGTRDAAVRVRQWRPDPERALPETRTVVEELAAARPLDEFLPGSVDPSIGRIAPLTLSACQPFELAKEIDRVDGARGVFSVALLDTLAASGPTTTYRSLLAGVRSRVEREVGEQRPVIDPIDVNGPADSLVLDGTIRRHEAAFHVTRSPTGFEVDAGTIHGLRSASAGEAFDLACLAPGTNDVVGLVRVTAASAANSVVEPLGWAPEDRTYEAVIAAVPLPAALVRFDPGGSPDAVDRVRAAIRTAGPGDTPSPYLVMQDEPRAATATAPAASTQEADRLVLRVAAVEDGSTVEAVGGGTLAPAGGVAGPALRILRPDGTPVVADQPGHDAGAARAVVARLEHIARWEQVKALGDHPSRLRDAIRLVVYPAKAGETGRPAGRRPLTGGLDYRLDYQLVDGHWQPPAMFLELVNTADRDLFVGVLDLTDRFRCHASLFPTGRIHSGHTVVVWDRAIDPGLVPPRPGCDPGRGVARLAEGHRQRDRLRRHGLRAAGHRPTVRTVPLSVCGHDARAPGPARPHPERGHAGGLRREPGLVRRYVRGDDRRVVTARAVGEPYRLRTSRARPQRRIRTETSTPNAASTRMAAAATDASRSPPPNSE